MAKQTKGYCKYCGKEYTKGGMLRHLASCQKRKIRLERESTKTRCGYFQVVIYAKYDKDYWLIIEISENATLKDLDQFIRNIWVECCGHLSAFDIAGVRYEVMLGRRHGAGHSLRQLHRGRKGRGLPQVHDPPGDLPRLRAKIWKSC